MVREYGTGEEIHERIKRYQKYCIYSQLLMAAGVALLYLSNHIHG